MYLGHPTDIFHSDRSFPDDRDIEFICLARWMENMYADGTMKLDSQI